MAISRFHKRHCEHGWSFNIVTSGEKLLHQKRKGPDAWQSPSAKHELPTTNDFIPSDYHAAGCHTKLWAARNDGEKLNVIPQRHCEHGWCINAVIAGEKVMDQKRKGAYAWQSLGYGAIMTLEQSTTFRQITTPQAGAQNLWRLVMTGRIPRRCQTHGTRGGS